MPRASPVMPPDQWDAMWSADGCRWGDFSRAPARVVVALLRGAGMSEEDPRFEWFAWCHPEASVPVPETVVAQTCERNHERWRTDGARIRGIRDGGAMTRCPVCWALVFAEPVARGTDVIECSSCSRVFYG